MAQEPTTGPVETRIKVVDSIQLDGAIKYTADRIRVKSGETDKISWDSTKGLGDAIDALPTDRQGILEDLSGFSFSNSSNLTEFIASIPNVTSLTNAFQLDNKLTKIELTVTNKLTSLSRMFGNRRNPYLEEIIFNGDLSKVTSYYEAFACGETGMNDTLKKIHGLDFTSTTNVSEIFVSQRGLEDVTIKPDTLNVSMSINTNRSLSVDSCVNILNALKDRTGQDALTLTAHENLKTESTGRLYANYVKLDSTTNLYVSCESADEGAITIAAAITAKNWTIA